MSSSGGGSRVSIPEHFRKTIQDIKDITGKQHADEDVFAMLKECSMDPNETVQKLLYLDTFHEVKSKKDRRREISNNKVPESKFAPDGPVRGPRGNRNFSSGIRSGLKTQQTQREKRGNNFTDRASEGPASAIHQKLKDNAGSNVIKPSISAANGPSTLSNGVSGLPQTPDSPVKNVSNAVEASASGVSSSLDPVIAPVLHRPSGAGPVKREIGVKRLPSGNSVYKKKVPNKIDTVEKDPHPQFTSTNDGLSTIKQQTPVKDNASVNEGSVVVAEITPKVASVSIESNSESLPASTAVSDSQHVTFPNHFQVSEAFKNGLTFGSFDVVFAAVTDSINGPVADNNANSINEPSQGSDEIVEESSPSNQTGDLVHMEVPLPSEEESLKTTNLAQEDPKPDSLLPSEVPQRSIVQDIPSNTFSFISPLLASSTMQSEVSETQAPNISRPPHFTNDTVPTVSSPIPIAQTSMAMPPQQMPIYRPSYPINYFPYGPYLTPIYMSPIHQLLSHNAAFQHPSTGNLYLPPAVAAAAGGVKVPFPMYKSGNNTPIGIPSGYSPYGSTSMAYSATPAVTSGTSANNEDLAASQLKENHIYSTAHLSEAPAVWIPPVGQDLTSLQVNSLYNLPQGQQITFSPAQAGHGAFGMQQRPQSIASAPSVHPHLQQSQAGNVETAGLPPGGAYQLPQHAQINWNANF